MDYYVYALFDPLTNKPFYIGKGKNRRAHWHLTTKSDPNWRKRKVIAAIRNAGAEPVVVVLHQNLTEKQAFETERQEISRYGRRPAGLLVNMTDGGEGQSGFVPSLSTRRKIAKAERGARNHFFGCRHTPEALAKIGSVNKGKPLSEAQRHSISQAMKGKVKTAEHRRKIAESVKRHRANTHLEPEAVQRESYVGL